MVNSKQLCNEDELHPPEWLNEAFLTKVLLNKEGRNTILKITNYVITPGTGKSDHYASIIFRAKVNYALRRNATEMEQQKFQSMIIKTTPITDGDKKELMERLNIFETEIKMYAETLPLIESVLRKHNDPTKFGPGILYYSIAPIKCIVFDDLVAQDYSIITARTIRMNEVKATLLKLAKLHAVSYKLAKEGNSLITCYNEGMFSKSVNEHIIVRDGFQIFKAVLSAYDDLQKYVPHIENIEADVLKSITPLFTAYADGKHDRIFVLNHGDVHMKNIMMKYNNKHLDDVLLLDYQISFFGSAAIDLLYANILLFHAEMRSEHRDELFAYYVQHFQDTLKLIEYSGTIPTLADFQLEMFKHRKYELLLFIAFLIYNYVYADEDGDLAKAVEDAQYKRNILNRPEVLKEIRKMLPILLDNGYFSK